MCPLYPTSVTEYQPWVRGWGREKEGDLVQNSRKLQHVGECREPQAFLEHQVLSGTKFRGRLSRQMEKPENEACHKFFVLQEFATT